MLLPVRLLAVPPDVDVGTPAAPIAIPTPHYHRRHQRHPQREAIDVRPPMPATPEVVAAERGVTLTVVDEQGREVSLELTATEVQTVVEQAVAAHRTEAAATTAQADVDRLMSAALVDVVRPKLDEIVQRESPGATVEIELGGSPQE